MQNPEELLKQYFGYDRFRKGQKELVDRILAGGDVLGIMPTGAGKSICYQIPALAVEGITVVVSPLISLMKDQVDALSQAGIAAAYINSSLSPAQLDAVYANARNLKYKILYVAPERLETEGFSALMQALPVSIIAVDEAHCVSQWGHDFRPSYTNIAAMAERLPVRPVMAAFTATATPQVKDDIVRLLSLRDPYLLTTGFDRENLYYAVQKPADKTDALLAYLARNREKSGIVYASTRKTVDSLYTLLNAEGYPVARYHAGMPDTERTGSQNDFIYDRANVMIATNAFGMGIDKSNISYVIHYNMPKNIESYYQEAGRAGRDGEKAECILYYAASDVITNKFLIANSGGEEDKAANYKKLNEMIDYCNIDRCLREYILRYFGETDMPVANTSAAGTAGCGNCGNCCSDIETTDITVEAQKILSCVKRMGERFGSGVVTSVLRGKTSQRIRDCGFERLSTYGIMKEYSKETVKELISFLVSERYAALEGDQYPVLKLTPAAYDVLRGKTGVSIRRVLTKQTARYTEPAAGDEGLYELLRALRAEIAQREQVPPYVIFSNATLVDMSRKYPTNRDGMLGVSGVGAVKYERYGDAFTAIIKDYIEQNNIQVEAAAFPPAEMTRPTREKPDKVNDTKKISYALAQQGMRVAEIAQKRGLAPSTVTSHLLACLQGGLPVDGSLFVTEDEERLIIEVARGFDSDRLTPIKQALPEQISYDAIRYVLYKLKNAQE